MCWSSNNKAQECRKGLVYTRRNVLIAVMAAIVVVGAILSDVSSSNNDDPNNHSDPYEQHQRQLKNVHKALFPIDNSDKWGLGFASLALMIAAGGGIGGGGMLVPIYILVLGFKPKYAIPLSNVTVLGGSLANTMVNWKKRHPLTERPLIDWDLILIMEPLTIGGALIGAILNKVLPEQIVVLMLVLLLSFTAYTTLTKAVSMYKKETKAMKNSSTNNTTATFFTTNHSTSSQLTHLSKLDKQTQDTEAQEALLDNIQLTEIDDNHYEQGIPNTDEPHDSTILKNNATSSSTISTIKNQKELARIIEEEREIPLGNVTVIAALFFVVLLINVLKGGGAFHSPLGIVCGSISFWLANLSMLLWIFILIFFGRAYLVHRYHLKKACHYNYVEGDIQWDERATIVYPFICCFAGFFSGMFGIGGGIVKGPLMLQMGVHPAVAAASTATMILFTCFTATTSFVVFGLLQWDYAFVCTIVGFITTLIGQYGLSYLMKKYQRNSYIAFSVGFVVLISAFLMTIQSLISMAESAGTANNASNRGGGICT